MKRRTPIQYLRYLKNKQKNKIRLPHSVYPNEHQTNMFFYHINALSNATCLNIFSDSQHSFIWILEENEVKIGIELPFRKIQYFKQTEPIKAEILERVLAELIEKHFAAVENQLKVPLSEINYTREELEGLFYQYLTVENREAITLENKALHDLLHNNREARKIIKKNFQQGHTTLITNPTKSAYIGGDLFFDVLDNAWVIRNKSGRYGRTFSNPWHTLYMQTVHLLKMQSILQEKGIRAKVFIYYKPGRSPESLRLFYELINVGLENYFKTGNFIVPAVDLAKLADNQKSLFQFGMQHIENHIQTLAAPKPRQDALVALRVEQLQAKSLIVNQYKQTKQKPVFFEKHIKPEKVNYYRNKH